MRSWLNLMTRSRASAGKQAGIEPVQGCRSDATSKCGWPFGEHQLRLLSNQIPPAARTQPSSSAGIAKCDPPAPPNIEPAAECINVLESRGIRASAVLTTAGVIAGQRCSSAQGLLDAADAVRPVSTVKVVRGPLAVACAFVFACPDDWQPARCRARGRSRSAEMAIQAWD